MIKQKGGRTGIRDIYARIADGMESINDRLEQPATVASLIGGIACLGMGVHEAVRGNPESAFLFLAGGAGMTGVAGLAAIIKGHSLDN